MSFFETSMTLPMLHDSKDMPKFQTITDEGSIKRYGGDRMYFAPPIDYDAAMKRIPKGQVITVGEIRDYFRQTVWHRLHRAHNSRHFCFHSGVGKLPAERS